MKLRRVAKVASVVGFALCLIQMVLIALDMVRQHRGYETYQNVYGLQISWVSFLIAMGFIVSVLLVARIASVLITWRERREERALLARLDQRQEMLDKKGS
jgi:hypothetical protein